jgi:hypothetical protein
MRIAVRIGESGVSFAPQPGEDGFEFLHGDDNPDAENGDADAFNQKCHPIEHWPSSSRMIKRQQESPTLVASFIAL